MRHARLAAVLLASGAACLAWPEGEPGVVFRSDWSTAADTTRRAVRDNGRWKNYWEYNRGTGVQLISVVPGLGPNGGNALRVIQRGETFAANIQQDYIVPRSTDIYVRFYMRNDDTSSAGDHIVTAHTFKYENLTYIRKVAGRDGWMFAISLYGCGYVYPIGHWNPDTVLALRTWYRFEYYVHFVGPTSVQVYPRVYDANERLLLDEADFRQQNWGGASWNGRSDWTLASYYAAGYSFCVDPDALTSFGMGNNGQQGAVDTKLPWYFAAVEIRTDRWPGPAAPTEPSPP